ncbi:SWI/SNF complex subunit SWI3C-like [Salvia divinorum]|uniref:SWI/SNF complex subunit SWI3C-like n=1 Tax=Salvia divinorum TaxID=28513 RepID=A0ABD1IFE2_SALDI
MQLYNENWTKIAEHVGSKSKAQCILHFVRLPLDGAPLDNINVPSTSGSSNLSNDDDHGRSEPISNGICLEGEDTESKFPFSSSGNPVMSLVVFLASALGPRVAAACAHVSLGSLSKESSTEGSPGGYLSQHDAEADDGLTAAAMKAKLFADHKEREIQRLFANIINHQCGAPTHSTAPPPSHRLFGSVDDAASLASPGGQRRSLFSQVLWSGDSRSKHTSSSIGIRTSLF